MDNFLYWNSRGACSKHLLQNISSVCKEAQPCLLVLSETKCERETQFLYLQKLGFDDYSFVPSVGRSGGMIVLWKKSIVSVSILQKEQQLIHLRCTITGHQPFLLSAIYAIPLDSRKQALWNNLKDIAVTSEPWVVIGDFNDIALTTERTGGASPNPYRLRLFQDRMHACHLSDLGFAGPQFTWKGTYSYSLL
ncbi:hypothetical protein K1719_011776 [Acacia pycnantha]|nr:hypothetical protein K1719_011776 [Acacia pycnantha]